MGIDLLIDLHLASCIPLWSRLSSIRISYLFDNNGKSSPPCVTEPVTTYGAAPGRFHSPAASAGACEHPSDTRTDHAPLSRADWTKLMIAAARLPLRNEIAQSQFLPPGATAGSGSAPNYYQWV